MLMFEWFKKEAQKKDLEEEKYELPSFPDFPVQKGFAQTIIKNAVTDDKTFLPKFPQPLRKTPEIPAAPFENKPQIPEHQKADIFVKIEKFHAAQKSLQDAQEKVEEIEAHLKKLKEISAREELQLSSWEKEIEAVKAKIKEVSKNIFEKVE